MRSQEFGTGKSLGGGKVKIAGGGFRQGFTVGEAISDLVADDRAEFRVNFFLTLAVAHTAEVEIRAAADVALVLVGPADKAVVAIFGLHGASLLRRLRVGNGFCDLAFLVGFCVIALSAAYGDDSLKRRMLELAVLSFLTIQGEARLPEFCDEFSDFTGHGEERGLEEPTT